MPRKPKTPCQHPGCPELVEAGEKYCPTHLPLHAGEGAERNKAYNSQWRKARRLFLSAHPWCEECLKEGRYTPATDVDHIIAHRGDGALFWDQSNWRALCHSCHSKKTRREDNRPEYRY